MKTAHKLAILSGFSKVITRSHLSEASGCDLAWPRLLERLSLDQYEGHFAAIAGSAKFKAVENWFLSSDAKVTCFGDEDYPSPLLGWPDAPAALWYRGRPSWNSREFISVVGSRNAAPASIEWMNWQLAAFLAEVNAGVVSGGARGVDQRAHLLAVQAGRPTLALMPVGLMHRYPWTFETYEQAIIETGGAVVSPFAPQQTLFKSNFGYRNLVIAALSPLTLIVEARRRSGTMVTANAARDLQKALAVVPTSASSSTGMGNLDLLADGAILIRDALDLRVAWSSVVRSSHRPPGEISEDDVNPPDGDGGGEDLVSGQAFRGNVESPIDDDHD